MEPDGYHDTAVSKMQHFIGSVGLLKCWNRVGCTIDDWRSQLGPLLMHSFSHSTSRSEQPSWACQLYFKSSQTEFVLVELMLFRDWCISMKKKGLLQIFRDILWGFCIIQRKMRSRASIVNIATGYGLDDRGIKVWVPVGSRNFSSPCCPHRLWGPPSTQLPIQWVLGALSPGVKRPECEADNSPPTSAEVKKMWICTSTSPYTFMA
jgi:hypothetical protein